MLQKRSLATLCEQYRDYLLAVASRQIDSEFRVFVSPSDVVQETFLDAHRAYERFDGRTSQDIRNWLRRILLNNVTDAVRRHRKAAKHRVPGGPRPTGSARSAGSAGSAGRFSAVARLVDKQPTPRRHAVARETEQAMQAALARLTPEYQQVIRLRHHKGLRFAEIARRLGRTESAARKLWTRAVRQLQAEYEGRNGSRKN